MKTLHIHKKAISMILTAVLCLAAFAAPAMAAEADYFAETYPGSLYLVQSRHGTCTLASAAMMIRAALYQGGSDLWDQATEQDVSYTAWCSSGLNWSFTYTAGGSQVSVAHESAYGLSEGEVEALLAEHPEGFVLYCGNLPHAVYITGLWDGVIWCADPIYGYETTLADSYLGAYGGQDAILRNVTAYWYVADCTIG